MLQKLLQNIYKTKYAKSNPKIPITLDIFKSANNFLEKRNTKEDSSNTTTSKVLSKICNRKNLLKNFKELQSNNTTFAQLKFFNLKLFSLPHLNKININMNLNTPMSLLFFIFYQKKAFQKLRKMVYISSKKLFSFVRYWKFRRFFHSFPQFPDSKGQTKKGNFRNIFCNSKRDW